MAPRRPKRKVDNCTYVQQLFKNFLDQNRSKNVSEVLPKSVARPVQRFSIDDGKRDSLFRQGVKRNLLMVQKDTEQPNPVKEFFAKPANKPQAEINPAIANQPVHARFKRHEGSDQFVKCEPSPNAPPRGLAQWLNFRKKTSNEQTLTDQQNKPRKKAGEYLELPGNFFSGRESMKLPFEAPKNVDKTLMSIGSTFIPPATSTPFDGKPIICSPIISDPVELARGDVNLQPVDDCESFLQRVGTLLDQWCASIFENENTPLDRNYRTLREHWKLNSKKKPPQTTEQSLPASLVQRSSWKDHSLLSNQIHHQYRMQNQSQSLFSAVTRQNTGMVNPNDTSAIIEVQLGCDRMPRPITELQTSDDSIQTMYVPTSRKRKIIDALLTASPPSPLSNLSQILNEDTSFESPSKTKESHDTLQFDFDFTQANRTFDIDFTQANRSFDDFFSFDEPRNNDSFCLFPPTPDATDRSYPDDTIFFTKNLRENNESSSKDSFFDLFP